MKKAYFYFVPIYFNEKTNEATGRNALYQILLDVMITIHIGLCLIMSLFFPDFEFTFPIRIVEEIDI